MCTMPCLGPSSSPPSSSASLPSWARRRPTAPTSWRHYAMGKGMRRGRLAVAICCICLGLCLIGAHLAITHVTARGKPRPLWRAALPGLDIGADILPAEPGLGGYIEVWYEGHDADDYQPFLRLPGAPPLPM